MSKPDDTPVRSTYQVDAPANSLSHGHIVCEAYHRDTSGVDANARLVIRSNYSLELHTTEGTFPVIGYYFTKTATVIESNKTVVVDNSPAEPQFDLALVEIGISRKAWNLALQFIDDLRLIHFFDATATFDMPYIDTRGPEPTPPTPMPPLVDLRLRDYYPYGKAVR